MRLWLVIIFSCMFMKPDLSIGLSGQDTNLNQKCIAKGGIISPAWMVPEADIILEVGTPLEIYCTLESNHTNAWNYTSTDLIFRKGDRLVDSEHITLVNSTTARLYLDNLPITVKNKIFYCLLNSRNATSTSDVSTNSTSETQLISGPKTPSEHLICSNSVLAGSKPKKVVNFKCLSYNLEVLDCWWHEPNNGIETDYSIYYSTADAEESGENNSYGCPAAHSEPGHCQWTKDTSPPYKSNFEFMDFHIKGSNRFGDSAQTFRWHHYAHLVVAKPSNLTPLNTTPHGVQLQWDIDSWNTSSNIDLLYQVKYKQLSSKTWNAVYYNSIEVKKKNGHVQVNISDLKYPNMEYKFLVYVKLSISKKNPWSDAASVVVKTSPCAPYRSPETDIGGFEIYAERSNYRNVIIYWKQIPAEEHNGDNFGYNISAFENDKKVDIKPTSMSNVYAKFANLSLNAYKFYIKSVNANGSAPTSSMVYVPDKFDVLRRPFLSDILIPFEDDVHQMAWSSDLTHPIYDSILTNFTFFWCQSNHEDPDPCTNIFNWTTLSVKLFQHNYDFKHNFTIKPNIGYKFAVSTNSINSSSGMKWIHCSVNYTQLHKIEDVWVQKVNPYFVDIGWRKDCTHGVEGFRGYRISYCPVNDNHQNACNEDGREYMYLHTNRGPLDCINRVNITLLRPNTTYAMSVAMFTQKSLGPRSDLIYVRTPNTP